MAKADGGAVELVVVVVPGRGVDLGVAGATAATQLAFVEDTFGFDRARVARLEPIDGCRVLELVTPQDWTSLVDAHPLDATRAREDSWPEVTGGQGPWFLPDWYGVSREYDAVHLTVLAYLSTAGRALACQVGNTVLAGWGPHVTYWFTDTLTEVETPSTWATVTDEVSLTPRWILE